MRKPPRNASTARMPAQAASSVRKERPAVCAGSSVVDRPGATKTLIVARHFAYDLNTHRVDGMGNRQNLTLSGDLRRYVRGLSVALISSMDPHCVDSALVLAKAMMINEISCHDVLLLDDARQGDEKAALALIQKKLETTDVLIVMTHMELASSLPVKFGHLYGSEVRQVTLGYGDARVLVITDGKLTDPMVRQ